uniref:Uncharacterized protein n=1 Tax=Tetranychus urticae TaxID=32264 RepID=T1JWF4_TETUR
MDLDRSKNDRNHEKFLTLSNEHKGDIEARAESFNAADEPEKLLTLSNEHRGEIDVREDSYNAADDADTSKHSRIASNCEKLRAKAGERNNYQFSVAGTQKIQMFNRDADHNYDEVRDKLIRKILKLFLQLIAGQSVCSLMKAFNIDKEMISKKHNKNIIVNINNALTHECLVSFIHLEVLFIKLEARFGNQS